jgi:hypothetical protein
VTQQDLQQEELQQEELQQDVASARQRTSLGTELGQSGVHSSETAVSHILEQFAAEARRYRLRVRTAVRLGVGAAVTISLVNIIAIAAQWGADFPLGLSITMLGLFTLILFACVLLPLRAGRRCARLHGQLMNAARADDDVRVVGPLIEMLAWHPQLLLPQRARAMLIQRLPRLTSQDAHLLDAEQQQYLCGVLRNADRNDVELSVAILRAFEKVGDRSVLPLVERIADSPARTRRQRRLKTEAQCRLPGLEARVQQQQASQSLLRASSPTTHGIETLLHPVTAGETIATEHLLRPTATGESAVSTSIPETGGDST